MRVEQETGRTVVALGTVALLAVAVAACEQGEVLSPEQDVAADRGNSPVIEQSEDLAALFGTTIEGEADLTRTVDGVSVRFEASDVPADELEESTDDIRAMDAFTFWAVAFNNPNACKDDPCSFDDLFERTRAVGGTILNFGGGYDMDGDAVLEKNEGGGDLARFSTEGAQVLFPGPDFPPGLNRGIKNPYQAEIHVILRNHGPKESDPGDRAEQTSMVSAFCNLVEEGRPDRDNSNPPEGPDGCEDQGVAIFLVPGAPGANGSD